VAKRVLGGRKLHDRVTERGQIVAEEFAIVGVVLDQEQLQVRGVVLMGFDSRP
jgi:hypothetical protein